MKNLSFIVCLCLALFSFKSYSWDTKDLGEELAAPATTSAKYVLVGGATLTTLLVVLEDQVGDPLDDNIARKRYLGSSSQYGAFLGNMVGNVLYVGGMAIASQYGDEKAHDRAIGMLKASVYSFGVTSMLKKIVQEPRPDNHRNHDSFPSGHASASFSFSGFIAAEHGWGWGSAALAFSSFVAYSRINDNRHRLHDVVGGATIGWVYGWAMARKKKEEGEKTNSMAILPIIDSRTAGVGLYKEF